jgi:tetratricopeptide (TPR) repeat protein
MRRGILCLVFSFAALAQPPRDPMQTALQDYWRAQNERRFEDSTARRAEVRALLGRAPAESPQFTNWAQQVAQLYQNAGRIADATAIFEDAAARAGRLGDAYPARTRLLSILASTWQQDRNLLKAARCLEQAVAALDSAPAAAAAGWARAENMQLVGSVMVSRTLLKIPESTYVYQNLAALYQQLGRAEDAAAIRTKIETRLKGDDAARASFYASQGRFDDAADIYRRQAERAGGDPRQAGSAFGSLAYLYQQQERYADAAAAFQRALVIWQNSGLSEARGQTAALRQNLARMLGQSGEAEAAERIFQQMLADSAGGNSWERMQAVTQYADYLATTKRGTQAEQMLKQFLTSSPDLTADQQSSILFNLSNAARMSGNAARADEYRRAAMEKNASTQTPPPGQVLIAGDLQRAQSAAEAGRVEEAFGMALSALDAASRASDRDQVTYRVPSIAAGLAGRDPARADQLFAALLSVVEGWKEADMQPLLTVAQSYARFLINRPERTGDARQAIRRYQEVLLAARGPETGWLEDALRMGIDLERVRGAGDGAVLAAQDLVAFEESHNGNTSEPYLRAIETLAQTYEGNGDFARAAALRRETIALVDLVCLPGDIRRAYQRLNAASSLANHGQFDEAERLAEEAVAIGQAARPKQQVDFAQRRLEEIRRMRTAGEPSGRWSGGGVGYIFGPGIGYCSAH